MAETIIIQTEVRLAEKSDLLCAPKLLKLGQPFFVMTEKTNELVGVYILDSFTNSEVLQELFDKNRIYVPVVPQDDFIAYNLKQTDLKTLQQYGHNIYKHSRTAIKVPA